MAIQQLDYIYTFPPNPGSPPPGFSYENQLFVSFYDDQQGGVYTTTHLTTWIDVDGCNVDVPATPEFGCMKQLYPGGFILHNAVFAWLQCGQDTPITWESMGIPPGSTMVGVRCQRVSMKDDGTDGPGAFHGFGGVYVIEGTAPIESFPGPITPVYSPPYLLTSSNFGALYEAAKFNGSPLPVWTTHTNILHPPGVPGFPGFSPINAAFQASNALIRMMYRIARGVSGGVPVGYYSLFDNIHLQLLYEPPAGDGPWNLEDAQGRYHRAWGNASQLFYSRADHATPPFVLQTLPTAAWKKDSEPRMIVDHRDRLRMVFTRSFIVNTPTNLTVTALSNTRVRLTWTNTSTLNPAFRLFYQPGLGTTPEMGFGAYPAPIEIPAGSTSYEMDGMTTGQLKRFRLDAIVTSPTAGSSDDAGPVDQLMPP